MTIFLIYNPPSAKLRKGRVILSKIMTKQVAIKTPDGFVLDGLFETPDSKSKQCVVFCHGLSVDKEELGVFTKLAPKIVEGGYHTFRFDFRGCGKSTGQNTDFTVTGALTDLESVIEYLESQKYQFFIILAASFSGGCVSFYSGKNPKNLKGLILWNSLIDYEEKIRPTTERNKKVYGQAALDQVKKYGYVERSNGFRLGKKLIEEIWLLKPYEELLKFVNPTLFIHGTADTFVPYIYSKKYAKLMKNSRLVTIENAEHGFHIPIDYLLVESAVIKFIKKIFES